MRASICRKESAKRVVEVRWSVGRRGIDRWEGSELQMRVWTEVAFEARAVRPRWCENAEKRCCGIGEGRPSISIFDPPLHPSTFLHLPPLGSNKEKASL